MMEGTKPDGKVYRTEYYHKRKRYVVGIIGNQKRKFGIIEIPMEWDGKFGKSRVCSEFCDYETFDEAQSALDDYAKIAGFGR